MVRLSKKVGMTYNLEPREYYTSLLALFLLTPSREALCCFDYPCLRAHGRLAIALKETWHLSPFCLALPLASPACSSSST